MVDTQLIKEFTKEIKWIDTSKDTYTNFRNFVELFYTSHAKPMALNIEQADALEDRYMSIVNSYKNKDTIRNGMVNLLSIAIQGINAGGDFLGSVFEELELQNKDIGQFFTPYPISRLCAEINFTGYDKIIEDKGFITLSEPACGGGSMILACADILVRDGYNPAECLWVEAVDLAEMPYQMCFVQLCVRNIAARVYRANTITLEVFEQALTWGAGAFFNKHGNPFPKSDENTNNSVVAIEAIDIQVPTVQMDLFG
jgi:type I restriction-modification system DNA methylase subunit